MAETEARAFNGTANLGRILRDVATGEFDDLAARNWMSIHIPTSYYIGAVYLATVFMIKFWMQNRKAFELKTPLIFWNGFQSGFSILVVLNTLPDLVYQGYTGVMGYEEDPTKILWNALCTSTFLQGSLGAWHFVFCLSKTVELIDTYFIVLRKKPLIFLHYYHHLATMLIGYTAFAHAGGIVRATTVVNSSVHAVMYGYYFLNSINVRLPGWIARNITRMQIVQFMAGAAAMAYLTVEYFVDRGCEMDTYMMVFCWIIDVTYLGLFLNFFHQSYVAGGGKAKYQTEEQKKTLPPSLSNICVADLGKPEEKEKDD